ncbi:hypothetical protein ACO1O0_005625 [Amphichorda felina]
MARVNEDTGLFVQATRILRRHCVYLDSRERAETFVQCLSYSPPSFIGIDPRAGRGLCEVESLFLAPFPEEHDGFDPEGEKLSLSGAQALAGQYSLAESTVDLPTASSPDQLLAGSNPASGSLSLENYSLVGSEEFRLPALDNLTIAKAVHAILVKVAPTLKRLIIDMPLRSLYPGDDTRGVKPILRCAFEALVNMEEFVSIRDELFLSLSSNPSVEEPPVWETAWPKLRHIALYNADLDTENTIWRSMAKQQHIELAVFTRPDGLINYMDEFLDVKDAWISAITETSGQSREEVLSGPRALTFVQLDALLDQTDWSSLVRSWRGVDPGNRIRVKQGMLKDFVGETAINPEPSYDDNAWDMAGYPDFCQRRVLQLAVEGALWDAAASGSYEPCTDPDLA